MKNIFKILAAAIFAVSLSGCADFLLERQETSYDGATMISSKGALESAVLGIHRQMALSGFKSGNFCEWLAPASGLLHWHNTAALDNALRRWDCCLYFTRFAKHPESYDSFKSFYKTIYLCNHLLDIIGNSPVDEAYKNEIIGETYFVRAMAYFYLVRLYGDVSLITVAPKTPDSNELYRPRENFWTVYAQIIDDLNKAEKMMRSYDRMVAIAGGNSSGRVCDYAAVACRSLVYLTIGSLMANPNDNFWVNRTPDFSAIEGFKDFGTDPAQVSKAAFELALADAQNVIDNGPFELCPNYAHLFRWGRALGEGDDVYHADDWQWKERIWVMPRSPESTDAGSGLTMWALPNGYLSTDKVDNFGRCRPDRWFFQRWCEVHGGVKGETGKANANIYVSCKDPRLDINMIHTSFERFDGMKANCYPTADRIKTVYYKEYGFPYYKKYWDYTFNNSVGNADFYAMRFAEVILIAAEATANLHFTGANKYGETAMSYMNQIFARARNSVAEGKSPSEYPKDWTGNEFSTKEELLSAIFWERCFEMPFEHHEYFDTHRMGAQWIVDNISIPKNEFLVAPEQEDFVNAADGLKYEGYRSLFYGRNFLYHTNAADVRRGLINSYPYDELIYNSCLNPNIADPNYGQNPAEVCWDTFGLPMQSN